MHRSPAGDQRWFAMVALACGAVLGCQRGNPGEAPAMPAASPGMELQADDYAAARSRFQTKLISQGPPPQQWQPVRPTDGVTEVEYPSGSLRLKAWLSRTPPGAKDQPAVLFLHGGFAFGEDDWEMAKPFRTAGYVVMMPILRGENGQPGSFSMFYNEVDDVVAAGGYLAKLPAV